MSFVITNIGTTGNLGTAHTVTVTSAITVGTDVFVCIADAQNTIGTMADSKGNSYSQLTSHAIPGGGSAVVFHSNLTTQLFNNDTITYTSTASVRSDLSVFSVTGGNGLDTAVTASASGSSSTPSVTSGIPTQSGELFVGVVCQSNTRTLTQPAGGWAEPPNAILIANGVDGGNLVNSGAAALTYNPTFNGGSANWAAFIFSMMHPAIPIPPLPANDMAQGSRLRRIVKVVAT